MIIMNKCKINMLTQRLKCFEIVYYLEKKWIKNKLINKNLSDKFK